MFFADIGPDPAANLSEFCCFDLNFIAQSIILGFLFLFSLVCLRSRGPPGGPRRPREGPRIALGDLPGPPDPPGPGSENLKARVIALIALPDILNIDFAPLRFASPPKRVPPSVR
jgi:hypothetical protein